MSVDFSQGLSYNFVEFSMSYSFKEHLGDVGNAHVRFYLCCHCMQDSLGISLGSTSINVQKFFVLIFKATDCRSASDDPLGSSLDGPLLRLLSFPMTRK